MDKLHQDINDPLFFDSARTLKNFNKSNNEENYNNYFDEKDYYNINNYNNKNIYKKKDKSE